MKKGGNKNSWAQFVCLFLSGCVIKRSANFLFSLFSFPAPNNDDYPKYLLSFQLFSDNTSTGFITNWWAHVWPFWQKEIFLFVCLLAWPVSASVLRCVLKIGVEIFPPLFPLSFSPFFLSLSVSPAQTRSCPGILFCLLLLYRTAATLSISSFAWARKLKFGSCRSSSEHWTMS